MRDEGLNHQPDDEPRTLADGPQGLVELAELAAGGDVMAVGDIADLFERRGQVGVVVLAGKLARLGEGASVRA